MKKRYALVTGGARGIGRAICMELAGMDYHILVNYKSNDAAAEDTITAIEEAGGAASKLKFDVSNAAETKQILEKWIAENPESIIEVLVNNAGIKDDSLMAFMQPEQWSSVLDTSLGGMYHTTKAVLNPMLMHRFGRIVSIVSLSGLKGMQGQVNYSAAKAGVIGATKALALEVAKRKITVNAVAPGFIDTDMTDGLDAKELSKNIPAGRFGKAEEVAKLVGFLCSKDAGYITGQVISINGGLYT